MHGLSDKDPAVTIPMENATEVVAGHRASDHQMVTEQHWPNIVGKLAPLGRWSRVFGPLSSAIATLLDFGWQLTKLDEWICPDWVT